MNRLVLGLAAALLSVAPAHALVVLTVGPTGAYPTIQAALDDALALAGSDDVEVRVARGTYFENLRIPSVPTLGTLRLSGGWDPTFFLPSADPRVTIVDGGGTARTLEVVGNDAGDLTIENLTFRNGYDASDTSSAFGGNVLLSAGGSTSITLRDCRAEDGKVVGSAPPGSNGAAGAGLYGNVFGKAVLNVERVVVEGNRAVAASANVAAGAGASFVAEEDGELRVAALEAVSNQAIASETGASAHTSAVDVVAYGNSRVTFSDASLVSNEVVGDDGPAVSLSFQESSRGLAQRNVVIGNRTGASDPQVRLAVYGDALAQTSEWIVADGDGGAVRAWTQDSGVVRVTNWTVAGHAELGGAFSASGAASVSVYDSVFWNNGGADFVAGPEVDVGSNLTGDVDPLFVDEAGDDFQLAHGSPGIDAGDDLPPGGLGPSDYAGNPRIQGRHVDIGAYETRPESDPIPICRWLDFPVIADANVCLCAADPGLRANRCTFRSPDLVLVARFPRVLPPGDPYTLTWTILPWTDLGTEPYSMSAFAEIDGQWKEQQWLGPKAPYLENDSAVREEFSVEGNAKAETPLRTTVRYQRRDKSWTESQVELVLPPPVQPPQ